MSGNGEAALRAGLLLLVGELDAGIDEMVELSVISREAWIDREDAEADTDLRG